MKKWLGVAAACALAAFAVFAQQQRDWSQEKITAEQVRGNIWMLVGTGGNIGVSAGEDGILIIDDKFAPLAEKIRAALAGINPGKLKFILNTHWHGDHTGANPIFGPDALIIAHANVRERLKSGNPARKAPPMAKEGWPVVTFDESLSVHFNGEEIKVIHFPKGHTDGDSVMFFTKSNVVHLGDDFFVGRFPFVDLDSGGTVDGLRQNIGALIQKIPADAKIIPGHGPLSTLDDLKAYHAMLVETIEHVREKMKAGKPLDEIKKEGLPEKYKDWASSFITADRWIETIFRSASGESSIRSHIHVPRDPSGHGHPH
jgi:cyclase